MAAKSFDRKLYAIAAVASLALSIWGAWAQFIPNPDGALYLRAAELFADGRWSAAMSIYRWPTYSALIATVMTVTGLNAFLAAQLANAIFAIITTVAFMALVNRLANRDRLVFICAAIVILLQPQLVQLRPVIIRDNGYFAFLLLALYFVVRDLASPRLATKFAIAAAIVVAGLFRIEGFFLGALVLIYYLAQQVGKWNRSLVLFAVVAAALLAIFGLLLWMSGTFGQWLTGRVGFGGLENQLAAFSDAIAARLNKLKFDLLYPYGGGNSWGAYIGMTIGITTVNVVRAMSIPLAILTIFAFVPKRMLPQRINEFVLWFALGQLPMLLVFTFATLLLDPRYAVGMALILDIALAFLLAELVRQWRTGSSARFCLPVAAVVIVATWAVSIPRPSKLAYLKEAGQWIGQQAPNKARILTNDPRIAYFSGRPYDEISYVWTQGSNPFDAGLSQFDYFVFKVDNANNLPAMVRNISGKQLLRSFAGKDGDNVLVYVRK